MSYPFHFDARVLQQFQARVVAVKGPVNHTLYPRLYYQLGTFDTWRVGAIKGSALTSPAAVLRQLRYGVRLGMKDERVGLPLAILAHVVDTEGVPLYPSDMIILSFTIRAPTDNLLQ